MKMIVFVILIFLISTDALSQIDMKMNEKCLEELRITKEELLIIKNRSPQDPKIKCFFRCLLEKFQLIADDKIIPGAFKEILGPKLSDKKVEQVESKCHKTTRSAAKAKCDFGYSIFKCYNLLIKNDLMLWRKKNQAQT